MCLGLIVPNYLTSYRRGCRVMSKCDVKTRRIRGCIIAVRNVNKFYSVLNGLTIVVNVLFLPVDIPGAVGRTAGQSFRLASSLAVCVKLNLYGLRTLAITVCIVVPHDLSIYGLGFLIASDSGFPLVLSGQVIEAAVALAPLSSGQVVPSIRLNSGAILGCGCLITFVEHCCCGCVIPTERVVNRNSSASGAPYREVLDRASPSIALTSERYGTNLRAIAVNINGNSRRTNCIIIIAVVPVCREIEANRLGHGDCAVITVVGCVSGVLINICDFCRPNNRMAIKIGRQTREGISPRVCVVLNCVSLSKVDGLILNAISQQLNIYAVGIRSIVPGVVVIHPAQIDCEVLLSLAYIVTVVLMGEVDIQAIIFTVNLVVPSSNAGGTSRCIVEDFVSHTIIDGVLLQAGNRVGPARRTIAAPLGHFNSTHFCTGGISYLASNAIQFVSTNYTLLSIGTHINGEVVRAVSALVICVEPVNMTSFSACCSSLLQGYYNLVSLNIGFREFDVLRGYNLIIRCTKLRVQRYGCVVLDLITLSGVNRKLREGPLHAVYIKVNSVLVVSAVNRNAISGQSQVQRLRAYAVRVVVVVKAERYAHISLSRLVRQVQVHACGHRRINLGSVIVNLDGVVDQLTILILVKTSKVGNPNVRVCSVCILGGQRSGLAYYLLAISIKLYFDRFRTLCITIVFIVPVNLSRNALGLGAVSQVNLNVVRINSSCAFRRIGYFVAVRCSYFNGIYNRRASCALIVIVRCDILPGLSPVIVLVKLESLTGCLAVSIKFANDLIRTQIVIVIVIVPIDVAGNITDGRRVVQMYVAAFHRYGITVSILQIVTEVFRYICQISNLLTAFAQRKVGDLISPGVVVTSSYGVGLNKGLHSVNLLVQINLDGRRTLAVTVLVIVPTCIQIYCTLISAVRQFDVSLCRVCQVCCSVAVSIHVRCGIADNLFFLAVGHGNVGAIDGILYSLFYRSGIQNFLTLFAITVNRKVLKGIIPSIGSLIATQNMLISSAFHLLTISIKLKNYSRRTDVIIVLSIGPLYSYRNRLSIAIMRYLDIEFACGPSVTISSLCDVSIKVRGNLCLIDNFLTAIVLFHISKCVSPKVEVLTAVDGCSAYIYRFPTIGLGIPLISSEFNIHRFRTSVVSVAFIIPVNRNGFVNQFNVTGDDSAIFVTCRLVCTVEILSGIVVLIVLSCLVVISNRSGIGDCLTIKVLLIVSPSISPYVSVIRNSANSGVSTYNASARVVTQKVLYSLAVSIQVQRYRTRTNAIIVAVIVPLDGKLHIIAGCNQTMI